MQKTLLDEFAMFALQGILANPQRSGSAEGTATMVYCHAKAMMEERKKHIEVEDDGWIDWYGGIDPVKRNQLVEVIFRNGTKMSDECEVFIWHHDGSHSDIIKYRVIK